MLSSGIENLHKKWLQLDRLTLEYNYKQFMDKIILNLNKEYSILVNKYRDKTKNDVFVLNQDILDERQYIIQANIALLKNAIELSKTSINVSDNIAPILMHYSWYCLLNFFNYSLFYWKEPHAEGHGARPKLKDNPEKIQIEIHKKGIFKRAIDTMTLLGNYIAFSEVIPIFNGDKIEFIDNPNNILKQSRKLSINDLFEFDYYKWFQKLNLDERQIVCNSIGLSNTSESINRALFGYLLVFISSNIARYRPSVWNEILMGKTEFSTKFIQRYRNTIDSSYLNGRGFVGITEKYLSAYRNQIHFFYRINGTMQKLDNVF